MSRRLTGLVLATALAPAVAVAQQATLTVTGRVTDDGGRPIAGAQVGLVGAGGAATVGTLTNDDGAFRLVVRDPRAPVALLVRAIGYAPARATLSAASGTATQDFRLQRDVLQLSQIVTTGTRTETERAQLGATLASVQGEAVSNAATPQVDIALSGKVAGALVTQNSGTPGGGTSVRIRGLSTISRSADPLYIVDGVIVDNGSRQLVDLGGYTTNRLADLDPNDIERIEVVKGAAAAALYGSRANDGVVQIFTRRGRPGALRGSARVAYGTDDVLKFVPVNRSSVNAAGQPTPTRYDYQHDIFRRAGSVNANVSIDGGDERTRFLLSGTHQDQQGVMRATRYVRDNVRLNLDRELSSWLRVAASTSYIQSDADLTPNGGIVANYGVLTNFLFMSNDRNLYRDPVTGEFPAGQFQSNPLDVIANWKAPQGVGRWVGGINLTATPRAGLTIDYRAGYDGFTETAQLYIPRGSTAVAYPTGYAQTSSNRARLLNSDLDASWRTQPTPWLVVTPSVGMNWQQQRYDLTTAAAQDLALLTQTIQGSQQFAGEVIDDRRTLGFYGQLQAGVHERLFLTAALRSDASSAFGSSERTQLFPKLGLSYDALTPALKDALGGAVSRLRLRAAVGQSGGQPAGSFDRFSNYVFEPAGTASGIVNATRRGNEALKPERQKETELGLDAEFLRGRAGLEATYFDKQVEDLILPKTVLPSSGYLDQLANVGTLKNRGLELLARVVPVQTRAVTWTATGTVTTSNPKVTRLSSGGAFFIPGSFNIVRVATDGGDGSAPGHFFGTSYVRNAQGQILGRAPASGSTPARDSVPVVDASGNIVAVPYLGPRTVIGNPNARAFWSVSNELQVGRRLSFRAQVDGVSGVDIFNFDRRLLETPAFGSGAVVADEWEGRVPRGYFQARRSIFEEYVENGAFAKLRELSVSWTLDPKWVRVASVRGASVTLAGRNLHTWTKYTGWDPETNAGAQSTLVRGFAFATTPIPRNVTVAATLTF